MTFPKYLTFGQMNQLLFDNKEDIKGLKILNPNNHKYMQIFFYSEKEKEIIIYKRKIIGNRWIGFITNKFIRCNLCVKAKKENLVLFNLESF